MQIEAIGLGEQATDTSTGLHGKVTHFRTDADGRVTWYGITERGLDEDGDERRTKWTDATLVVAKKGVKALVTYELPDGVLRARATNDVTGYKGKVVGFILHHHGCIHVALQANTRKRNGDCVDWAEVNLLDCVGPAFKKFQDMTKAEVKQLEKAKPSPAPSAPFRPF